jgi:cytoskeleton-associated protein 5
LINTIPQFIHCKLQEKLKEKRPTLTDALTQTLHAMHQSACLSLMDVIEGKNLIL